MVSFSPKAFGKMIPIRSKNFTMSIGLLIVAILGVVAFRDAVGVSANIHNQQQTIQKLDTQKTHLHNKLDETNQVKQQKQLEVQTLEKQKQDLEQERQRLEGELQAKAQRKAEESKLAKASSNVIRAVTFTQTASAAVSGARSGCGDNEAAAIIYGKESGGRVTGNCDTAARNSLGCIGIGQNCPDANGHYWLVDKCPDWETNYACQNQAFTEYAVSRYGSWQGALEFHQTHNWW